MRRNAYLLRVVGAVVLFSALQAGAQTSSSLRPKHPYMTPAQIRKGLPETLPPERFSYNRYIESGYRVAKRLPEAVAQQPCLCPCQKANHRSLLDCFASEHAASCDICQREVHFVAQKAEEGVSPDAVRTFILKGQF